jgi:hypothetical protein
VGFSFEKQMEGDHLMATPKTLYNYTSQRGLLGILDIASNTRRPRIWMTNILYLNDSSEYTYTFDLVMSALTTRMGQLHCKIESG